MLGIAALDPEYEGAIAPYHTIEISWGNCLVMQISDAESREKIVNSSNY